VVREGKGSPSCAASSGGRYCAGLTTDVKAARLPRREKLQIEGGRSKMAGAECEVHPAMHAASTKEWQSGR